LNFNNLFDIENVICNLTGERININGYTSKKEDKSNQDEKADEVPIKSEEEKAPEEQNSKNEELEEALMDVSVGKMSQGNFK